MSCTGKGATEAMNQGMPALTRSTNGVVAGADSGCRPRREAHQGCPAHTYYHITTVARSSGEGAARALRLDHAYPTTEHSSTSTSTCRCS